MSDITKKIVDFAEKDNAKDMRDAFYSALQDKVMAHLENEKMRVAQTMFNTPDPMATVDDEAITSAQ